MTIDWVRLGNYLYGNKVPILAFFSLLFTSGIKTMPPPPAPWSMREWFYDWTHQFFNITNTRLTTVAIAQPPLPVAVSSLPIPVEGPVLIQKK